jgi:hypothetical membrane protein
MALHDPSRPQLDVPFALRVVGLLGLLTGIATIVASTLAYAASRDFSFFNTYISDFGVAQGWPSTLYSAGMLLVAPLRYLFLVLLLVQLAHLGAGRRFVAAMATLGAFVVAGSVGVAAIPYTLDVRLHEGAALLYFFGTVVLQGALAVQEWRLRLPRLLPLTGAAVVLVYLVFATLLASVGKVEGVDRATPVIWEWLAFLALMLWLGAHTMLLGSRRPGRG